LRLRRGRGRGASTDKDRPPRVPRRGRLPPPGPGPRRDPLTAEDFRSFTANQIVMELAVTLERFRILGVPVRAVVVPADRFPNMREFNHLPVVYLPADATVQWGVIV
jgi:hypothetical protein